MQLTGKTWHNGVASDIQAQTIDEIATLARSDDLIWLDLAKPDADSLGAIGRALGLDPHALEDALADHERAKATRFEDYTFSTVYAVTLHEGTVGKTRLMPSRISAFALPKTLLTVRTDERFDFATVIERWREDPELVAFGVDGLLQGLLDVIIDQHFDVLQSLDDQVEELIDLTFAPHPDLRALQQRTFHVRAELVGLRRIVTPMRDVIATLIRAGHATRGWDTSLLTYYEDINDHVIRASEWEEGLRDLISGVYETNLSLNDTRMNEIMKKLAAWAAMIAVPTMITGFYGMNVPYWGFSEPAGFISVLVLIVAAVTTLFIVFKHNDWL